MKFLNTFEAAKFCGVSPGSVLRWIHDGKLPAANTGDDNFRVSEEDLLALMKNLDIPIPTEPGKQEQSVLKRVVLIVDDEVFIRRLLRNFFEETFPAFEVKEAKNGFEAGWIARSTQPDLILLDLMLPGMNGQKICELIRGFPGFSKTKIIAMSGYGVEQSGGVLEHGADDFLEKPFQWSQLKEKVLAHLDLADSELGDRS